MLKFFKCDKCGWSTCCPERMSRPSMQCGAVAQYLIADDASVGQDGRIQSAGIKPIGCGGNILEISEEEAMSYE